jgi:hypothetical protein
MKHDWETLEMTLSTVLLRCRNCGVTTNNAFLAMIWPCEPKKEKANDLRETKPQPQAT